MVKVYVSSPYTIGDTAVNVRTQLEAADKLIDWGYCPVAPLVFSHFQHMFSPKCWEKWMEIDLALLACCDIMVRLPGASKGADLEEQFAKSKNIPVLYNLDALSGKGGRFGITD